MAENTSSNFSDVFELRADIGVFKASLDELTAVFDAWVAKSGQAISQIGSAGSFAGIIEELSKIRTSYDEFGDKATLILEKLTGKQLQGIKEVDEADSISKSKRLSSQQDLATAIEGGFNLQQEEIRKTELLYSRFFQQIETSQEKLNAKLQASNQNLELVRVNGDAQAKIELLTKRIQELQAALLKVREQQSLNVLGPEAKESVALVEKQIQLQNQLATTIKEKNSAQAVSNKENVGFLDKFNGGLLQSITHLTRVYLVFTLINTAVEALTLAIKGPFDVLARGVEYLQNIEKSAYELAVPLQANVKFSEDIAQNFILSQDAAKELIPLLQTKSLQSGLPLEQLENVFKALSGSGASQSVKTVRDLATFSEAFSIVLKSSGRNALAVNGEIAKLSDLFSGANANASLFLQTLKITPAEWEKILKSSKEHKDILEQLEPKIRPYLEAAHKVGESQATLIDQLKLLISQLEGAGAAKFYEGLSGTIESVTKFFKDNQDSIIRGIELFASWVSEFITLLKEFAALPGIAGYLKTFFVGLLILLDATRELTVGLSSAFAFLVKTIASPLKVSDNWKEYQKRIEESLEKTKELFDFIQGKQSKPTNGAQNPFGAGASVLDQTIQGKPGPTIAQKPNQAALAKADYDLAYAQYRTQVDRIKAVTDQEVEDTKNSATARTISYKQASTQIQKYLEVEQFAITLANDRLKGFAARQRELIQNDPNLVGAAKELALTNFDKEQEALTKAAVDITKSRIKEKGGLIDRANAEDLAIAKNNFDTQIRLAQQANAQKLAIDKELYQNGYLSQKEFLAREAANSKEAYDIQVKILEDEAAAYAEGTPQRQAALSKRILLDQQYTNALELQKQKRIQSLKDEAEANEKFLDTLRSIALQREEIGLKRQEIINPKPYYSQEEQDLFNKKDEELVQLQKEAQARLDEASALDVSSEKYKKLFLEVEKYKTARQDLITQELSAIVSKTPSASQAKVLENQISKQAASRDIATGADFSVKVNASLSNTIKTGIKQLASAITGIDINRLFDKNISASDKFALSVTAASKAATFFKDILNTYQQGSQQGGVLGGVGAVTSSVTGSFGKVLSGIQGFGKAVPFLEAAGPILEIIGSLFTSAAKKIAEDVKKSFQKTVDSFNNGNTTLVDTINALERQRADAIARLSGKKGGQDQLNQILPEFDKEIQSLQKQQKDIITSFDLQLKFLLLQSDTLSTIEKQWSDINKQVKDYLDAGGDATKAQQFLSLQLQNIQKDAISQLQEGEKQAIQDAISLNDLLDQRNKLEQDFAKTKFDLINADSLERKQAGVVTRGQQLADAQKAYDDQLAALNDQIDLTTQKVNKEKQIFDLSGSIADLHRRDEQFALDALDAQILKYNDLKSIIDSITIGPDGLAKAAGGTSSIVNNIDITVNGGPSNTETAQVVSDAVTQALVDNSRQANY